MRSGSLVAGECGKLAGWGMEGGSLIVGSCCNGAGNKMGDGSLVVGECGNCAGWEMKGGSLVAGSCGSDAGWEMKGGIIIAGKIKSVALGSIAPGGGARIYTGQVVRGEKEAVEELDGILVVDRAFKKPIREFMDWSMGRREEIFDAAERGGLFEPMEKLGVSEFVESAVEIGKDASDVGKNISAFEKRRRRFEGDVAAMRKTADLVASKVGENFGVPGGGICAKLDALASAIEIDEEVWKNAKSW